MKPDFKNMSNSELHAYVSREFPFPGSGNLWTFLLVFVPCNLLQCVWATQFHPNTLYFGMPMNLVWIWASITLTAIAVVDAGAATARNNRQTRALCELLLRQQTQQE